MDECNTASELVKRITLLDAIHWLQIAWLKVEESTIAKCFAKTGFVHTNSTTESSDASADADSDDEEWDESDLIPLRQVIPNVTNQDLLNVDSELAVTKEYTTEEIDEFLEPNRNVDSEHEEDDIPNDPPNVPPPSNKEVMEMTSKILLYANESPDIPEEQRDMHIAMATKLYDTQANLVITQKMKSTKQLKIDSFFSAAPLE